MLYPFLFKPIFQERIWGGRSLETLYAKKLPPNLPIGESWEISDRSEAQSEIVNGPFTGKTLEWLMAHHRAALLGNARPLGDRFPLLVKILDAREKLSLQVHPPADKATTLGGDPKTEMWVITDARPGAELYVGLRRGATRREFEERIRNGTVEQCFHRVPVQAGDAMFLPSGRVHAIGAGLVIFEIQQNSDTTYRVFDWNRLDPQGKPRALHIQESLESIDFEDFEPSAIRVPPTREGLKPVVNDPLFQVSVLDLPQHRAATSPLKSCAIVAVISGSIEFPAYQIALQPGMFSLCPAALASIEIRATRDARVLLAQPGS